MDCWGSFIFDWSFCEITLEPKMIRIQREKKMHIDRENILNQEFLYPSSNIS